MSREEKSEVDRQRRLVKEVIYPFLVANCTSVSDMRHRVDSVFQAIEKVKVARMNALINEMKEETISEFGVVPLEGTGEDVEKKLLELLADENAGVVADLLQGFPTVIDAGIKVEMLTRKVDTLPLQLLDG